MKKATIIIPNYNGLKFMEPCMNALAGQTCTDFELLIIDNGSSDGSVEYLERLTAAGLSAANGARIPVSAVCLSENTGFSGAVNAGISLAKTPCIVLLNNDTEPLPNYLAALIEELERDTAHRTFAVSPKMIQLYHKDLLDDAGDGYNLLGWAFQRGVGQSVSLPRFQKRERIFSACAGAAIYRRDLLEEIAFEGELSFSVRAAMIPAEAKAVGRAQSDSLIRCREYFDQQHFAYLEDVDVSYRANRRGYAVYYCPDAEVCHVGSGTSGSKYNAFKVRLAARNNVWLNYKNMPFLQLLINLPGILLGVLIKQLFFARIGFGKEYRDGFFEGLRSLKNCRKPAFSLSQLPACIGIELRLLADTFSYATDFLRRRMARHK